MHSLNMYTFHFLGYSSINRGEGASLRQDSTPRGLYCRAEEGPDASQHQSLNKLAQKPCAVLVTRAAGNKSAFQKLLAPPHRLVQGMKCLFPCLDFRKSWLSLKAQGAWLCTVPPGQSLLPLGVDPSGHSPSPPSREGHEQPSVPS